MHSLIAVIGFVAAVLNTILIIPQLAKTLKTRKTRDLSAPTFMILVASSSLWVIYAFGTHTWPILFSATSGLVAAIIILGMKARYG